MNRREKWLFLLLLALVAASAVLLPSLGLSIYASPDETAHAVAAESLAKMGTVRQLSAMVADFPWAHPRSWVSVPGGIAPIGFLGWTSFIALFVKLFGSWILPWVGAMVLLSSVWPFFRLLQARFGFVPAWLGTAVVYAHPAMILYANRGLFPNGPVLAAAIWGVWLFDRLREGRGARFTAGLAGALAALALSIRPIEATWVLPWMIWAGWGWKPDRRQVVAFFIGIFLVVLPVAWIAKDAYGSPFVVGYWLRDPVVATVTAPAASATVDVFVLPFGIHPRAVLYNVQHFLLGLTWPWVAVLLFAALFSFWRPGTRRPKRREDILPWLCLTTLAGLLVLYGSGRYLDHVDPQAITIANSFLRYLLPVAPLAGLGFAYVYSIGRPILEFRAVAVLWVAVLACFGVFHAVWADDEGLATTRRELARYATIRTEALKTFRSEDLIASDRSDKVFFPAIRAVSPIPAADELARAAKSGVGVGLFLRPLTQEQMDGWRKVGLEIQVVGDFGREMLYRLSPIKR